MSQVISVQLDGLEVLLGELAVLAAELADDGALGISTGRTLGTALDGAVAAAAGLTGAAWAAALDALSTHLLSVTATLDAALVSYRAADEQLAQVVVAGDPCWGVTR